MRLAFIIGRKQGEVIKPRLQGIKDNLDIDVFDDIPEYLDSCMKRGAVYDRILVLSTKLNEVAQEDMKQHWGRYSRDTSIVMLGKTGADENKARSFMDLFRTPLACAMLVKSTTVQIIAEAVLRPTSELMEEYGIKDISTVEIEEDYFEEPEPKKLESEVKPEPEQVQKKRGLLGFINGGRKKSKNKQVDKSAEKEQIVESSEADNDRADKGFYSEPEEERHSETVVSEVDIDLGSETFQSDYTDKGTCRTDVSQVEEDDDGLVVGSTESAYRQQTERVTVKDIGGGSLGALLSGKSHKIIVVTGDRCTGVTTAAWSLANYFSKRVETLYFDCDIFNHGLLNYIDYGNFKNYEAVHQSGVKMCRTSKAFDSCVISWDNNMYLLTTDFSCDCTLDELQQAAQIVAERSNDVGVVVVDCPLDKLTLITDLLLTGQVVLCVEGTKRGFMNMLCQLEMSELPERYKRGMVARGSMWATKCGPKLDLMKLSGYIKTIYEPNGVDWMSMPLTAFTGKLSDKLVSEVIG